MLCGAQLCGPQDSSGLRGRQSVRGEHGKRSGDAIACLPLAWAVACSSYALRQRLRVRAHASARLGRSMPTPSSASRGKHSQLRASDTRMTRPRNMQPANTCTWPD